MVGCEFQTLAVLFKLLWPVAILNISCVEYEVVFVEQTLYLTKGSIKIIQYTKIGCAEVASKSGIK